jgi:hypothetical protein
MLSETTYEVIEGNPLQTAVCVELIGELDIVISVALTFTEDTATTEDFMNINMTLLFSSISSPLQCITLNITEDDMLENEEEFIVTLSSLSKVVDVLVSSAEVVILDTSVLVAGFESSSDNVTEGETYLACMRISSGSLAEDFVLTFEIQILMGGGKGRGRIVIEKGVMGCEKGGRRGLRVDEVREVNGKKGGRECEDKDLFNPYYFVDMIAEIGNASVEFTASNQALPLCASVVTTDDSIVEEAGMFMLQLVSGMIGERFVVQPSVATVTVKDDDSMCACIV